MKSNRIWQKRGLLLLLPLLMAILLVPAAQASGLGSITSAPGAIYPAQVATPSPTPCIGFICATDTPTVTPTSTSTPCFNLCATNTPSATSTLTPTDTPTATSTLTPTDTPAATSTLTPTDTPAATNTATDTPIPTDTPTDTPTSAPTNTPTPRPTNGRPGASPTSLPPATSTPLPPTSTPPAATVTASPTAAATITAAPSATVALLATATTAPLPTAAPATPTSAVPISVGTVSETSAVSSTGIAGPLEASKSANVSGAAVGSNINFTIKTRNRSRTITLTNVVVTDTVPVQLAIDSVMTSRPADVSVEGQLVVVKLGTLLPGDSVTIRIATTVRTDLGSGVQNVVYVNSNEIQGLIVSITIGAPPSLPQTGAGNAANLPLLLIAALLLGGLGLRLRYRRARML